MSRIARVNETTSPAGSMAAEWASRWFGGPTQIVITRPLAQLAAGVILLNNPKRVFWQIVNRSPANVSIDFAANVSLTASLPLAPSTGFASMAVQEDGEPVAWTVWGISDVAASQLYVTEVMRV